jgi:hypothetical protein
MTKGPLLSKISQTHRHIQSVIRSACPEPGDLWLSTQGFSGLVREKPNEQLQSEPPFTVAGHTG